MADKIPSGSVSVMETGSTETETPTPAAEAPTAPNPLESKIAALEEQLVNAQKLIGKQSGEVKEVREMKKQLEAMQAQKPAEPAGPSIEDQIDEISSKMENGDMSLRDGNRMIAQLSAQMGKQSAMSEFQKQRQQEEVGKVQQGFLKANPDYKEVLESGALASYLEADPMADEYTAYHLFKRDEKIKALETEYQAKIAQAKEEGAKIAAGADNAGKVAGKAGQTPRPTGEVKKFNNPREATTAMEAELARIRSQSG